MKKVPAKRMSRDELVEMIGHLLSPRGRSSEDCAHILNVVCINCPDPSAAMDILLETLSPVTADELVDTMLSFPAKDIADVPYSKCAENHPLRRMELGD